MLKEYFEPCMKLVLEPYINSDSFADQQLIVATSESMRSRLAYARMMDGRHGWWKSDVCSVDDLYRMRDKAIVDKDHVSVINFTAMIAMRESVEN